MTRVEPSETTVNRTLTGEPTHHGNIVLRIDRQGTFVTCVEDVKISAESPARV